RAEGLVLRYLSDAYRAMRQTVPESLRTDEVEDLTAWLGELVRQTDSSLLDEWEQLTSPGGVVEPVRPGTGPLDAAPPPVTANKRAFRVLVRNAMFRRVELAALRQYEELGALDADAGWDAGRWRDAMERYFAEYAHLGTGPDARGPHLLVIEEGGERWRVRQIFDDPEGDHDWGLSAEIDLAESNEAGEAVVRVLDVGPH
ncbi:MAG: DUF3516 domain-containing protein, partial [Actinomycetota bacterium]|nr:DUF3516 domain-containing protein [Actinomycetota bacterium]